jgi:2',3'-cyclic-nucleotide 2'-phosphodiesterase (5'-nucleotidase family)
MKKILVLITLFTFFNFLSCKDPSEGQSVHVKKIKGENIQIDRSISGHEELNSIIHPYRSSIEGEMNKALSYSVNSMFKNDTPYNTAIGNMMADAVFEMANPIFYQRNQDSIDAVLLNHGGIRAGINKGVITTRTAYQIMPFENMVVVAKLKGENVIEMFQYLAKAKRAHPISNMSISVDDEWKLKQYSLAGKKIETSNYYYIATSDYLVNGGDNMNFFQKADTIYQIDYKLRNLLIDYFKKNDTIQPKADDRFKKI